MFDTLVLGGELLDGTGADAWTGDIGIRDGRIAAVGDLSAAIAARRIDARGKHVAPGFIDLHTHSDFTLLADGRADSQVCQGVTTEVIGQCGFSCGPVGIGTAAQSFLGYREVGVDINWRSFGEYLDRLEEAKPALNVAAFVGHGAISRAVKGDSASSSTAQDIAAMVRLAEDAFDQGAKGLSTGLEYWPGSAAPQEELVAMAAVAAKRKGVYATHVRNRDVDYVHGFTEALSTAQHAGARLQISHIQPKFGAPTGAMQHTLELLYRAKREGVDVAFDVIPHDWSHTTMASVLPAWAREGGISRTLERLKDPVLREQMKVNPKPIWRLVTARRWEEIVLLCSKANPGFVGLSLAEIGRTRGVDPFDAVLDLLLQEGIDMPQLMWTSRSFNDADVCTCLREADCMVMSDTLALTERGPLKGMIGSLSGYGWTSRLLGHYVRERGVLNLSDAVSRITGKPAARLGLTDRGVLRQGAWADIVVFDASTVTDRSSFLMPLQHPTGIEHVIVNGTSVVSNGQRNDAQPGRVLRD